MPRLGFHPPDTANRITTYAELEEALQCFVRGAFPLVVILGRPGLAKSQSLKRTLGKNDSMTIKGGRISPLSFYTSLYFHQDKPVILDDADNLMKQSLCREYVKSLTETDPYKRLAYETNTAILNTKGVPGFFYTTSSVCIITNAWSETDVICQAIESRAEVFHFEPDWGEVYKQAATWFWDQEIFDYFHSRLNVLKTPDVRKLLHAADRKKGGTKKLRWQDVVDGYTDDAAGLVVRELLIEDHPTNTKRAELFVQRTGHDRATFYRRMQDIKANVPPKPVKRIILTRTQPPILERPADGFIGGD